MRFMSLTWRLVISRFSNHQAPLSHPGRPPSQDEYTPRPGAAGSCPPGSAQHPPETLSNTHFSVSKEKPRSFTTRLHGGQPCSHRHFNARDQGPAPAPPPYSTFTLTRNSYVIPSPKYHHVGTSANHKRARGVQVLRHPSPHVLVLTPHLSGEAF